MLFPEKENFVRRKTQGRNGHCGILLQPWANGVSFWIQKPPSLPAVLPHPSFFFLQSRLPPSGCCRLPLFFGIRPLPPPPSGCFYVATHACTRLLSKRSYGATPEFGKWCAKCVRPWPTVCKPVPRLWVTALASVFHDLYGACLSRLSPTLWCIPPRQPFIRVVPITAGVWHSPKSKTSPLRRATDAKRR